MRETPTPVVTPLSDVHIFIALPLLWNVLSRYGYRQDPFGGWVRESCSDCLATAGGHSGPTWPTKVSSKHGEMALPILALSLVAITNNFCFHVVWYWNFIGVTFSPSGVIKDLERDSSVLQFVCLYYPFQLLYPPQLQLKRNVSVGEFQQISCTSCMRNATL